MIKQNLFRIWVIGIYLKFGAYHFAMHYAFSPKMVSTILSKSAEE
jgi:hypothetical protein